MPPVQVGLNKSFKFLFLDPNRTTDVDNLKLPPFD